MARYTNFCVVRLQICDSTPWLSTTKPRPQLRVAYYDQCLGAALKRNPGLFSLHGVWVEINRMRPVDTEREAYCWSYGKIYFNPISFKGPAVSLLWLHMVFVWLFRNDIEFWNEKKKLFSSEILRFLKLSFFVHSIFVIHIWLESVSYYKWFLK